MGKVRGGGTENPQIKNKPYGIHTQMPLKQPQTFLLPQAANVVKQLLGWGTSKVHWEQQIYFSIKHRNGLFSQWNCSQASWFQKTLFRFAWPLHNLKRSSETSKQKLWVIWREREKTFYKFHESLETAAFHVCGFIGKVLKVRSCSVDQVTFYYNSGCVFN